ncbi:MAG: hypothetical protein AAFR00_12365 [Pseudomonadota bacterium]
MGLIDTLAALMAPAGAGDGPVSTDLARAVRRHLRQAEGIMRRALLAEALPLAEALSAPMPRAKRTAPTRQAPPTSVRGECQRFRLHEPLAPQMPRSPKVRRSSKNRVADPFAYPAEALGPEMERLACLITVATNPAPTIGRLARILSRRRARAHAEPVPFKPHVPPHWLSPPAPPDRPDPASQDPVDRPDSG